MMVLPRYTYSKQQIGRVGFILSILQLEKTMREHNRKYRLIANRLIRNRSDLEDIKTLKIKIAYLNSYEEKKKAGKLILGDCTKVDDKYKWCCDYDFFITLYEPNIQELSDEQLEILILHELYHVGIDMTGIQPKLFVRPHDVEEFDAIVKEFGLHWEV